MVGLVAHRRFINIAYDRAATLVIPLTEQIHRRETLAPSDVPFPVQRPVDLPDPSRFDHVLGGSEAGSSPERLVRRIGRREVENVAVEYRCAWEIQRRDCIRSASAVNEIP